jgi:hypothetical protein
MLVHSAETGLLSDCTAIVVAQEQPDCATLRALAERVGFGSVTEFSRAIPIDGSTRRLPYFLVHYGIGTAAKKQLLTQLRSDGADNVRYAPVVLFVPDGPADEMLFYIEMGFDDVICLPENTHILASRLASQIGQEQLFIETRHYLGPDRRRMEAPGYTHAGRSAQQDHTRLVIVRLPDLGVQVLSRQLFLKTL